MNQTKFFFLLLLLPFQTALSQPSQEPLKGEVTFLTSRNVYVKFLNTSTIAVGDTLRLGVSQEACLVVENKSSSSCVCVPINGCQPEKGAGVWHFPRFVAPAPPAAPAELPREQPRPTEKTDEQESEPGSVIRGRMALSSYSNVAGSRPDRHSALGQVAFSVDRIGNTGFFFDSHATYRQIFPGDSASFSLPTTYLRVYGLAAGYEAPGFRVVLGRSINSNISSIGAMDGLQLEKRWGGFAVGAIAGTRPDLLTYGVNQHLRQYGLYLSQMTQGSIAQSQTTLGLLEQRLDSQIDRRYAYLQHSSSFSQTFYLFASSELDLYGKINGVDSTLLRLTNLYLSAQYRMSRAFSIMVSYDARRHIVYYETFQTEVERLLDDDLARQGIRVRVNLKPARYVQVGLSASRRFQSNQENKSDNLYAYTSVTKLPWVGGSASLTFNYNISNYLKSQIAGLRYSRSFAKGKLTAEGYYRYARYAYGKGDSFIPQQYAGGSLGVQLAPKLMLSVSAERSFLRSEVNDRITFKLSQRIYSQHQSR